MKRRTVLKSIAATTAVAASLRSSFAADMEPIAETRQGKLRGAMDNGVCAFKGVRYGADTSHTRFRPPLPPESWSGVRDAIDYNLIAAQFNKNRAYDNMTEDCLVLNLWTPGLKDGKKRPVMVWLHGGGTTGGSNKEVYGGNLARLGDVVVLAINTRINAFGFLYLAEVDPELADSGNNGMLDIIRCLQWVRENAEAFGGDPGNVTVFGCSGGGAKLSMLLGMPGAKGLFHKAIIESGGSDLRTKSKAEAIESTTQYLKALNITRANVHELRTMPMTQLIDALGPVMGSTRFFSPVVDGRSFPRDSFVPDASPACADVSLIVGSGRTEYTSLLGTPDPKLLELTWDQVPAELAKQWKEFDLPHDPNKVVTEYRRMFPAMSPSDAFFLIVTDSKFWIGAVLQADRKAAQKRAPVYHYLMDWKTPVQGGRLKTPHGIEVPLVFNALAKVPGQTGGGPDAQDMSDKVSAAWAAFAHTGKPEAKGLPAWKPYDLNTRATMILNTESTCADDPNKEKRIMWEKMEKAVHA